MKLRFTFLRRSIAWVLALALLLSCTNMGVVLPALAAGTETVSSDGKMVALSYDKLSEAEKALLSSNLLAGNSVSFTPPTASDNLIDVDTNAKVITAKSYENSGFTWRAVRAVLLDGEEKQVETVMFQNGAASYTYAEKSFSVQVTYEMTAQLDTDDQEDVLEIVALLWDGKRSADAVYESDADLSVVALAMDALVMLANGTSIPFGGGSVTVRMGAEGAAAVRALQKQLNANGGALDLQMMNAAYASGNSQMEYLLENGEEYYSKTVVTFGYLHAISEDPILNNNVVDAYIQNYKPDMAKGWSTLKSRIGALVEALEPATEEWKVLGTRPLRGGLTQEDYRQLDALMAPVTKLENLTDPDELELTETVVADRTVISANASMVVVKLLVELETYNADNTPLVLPYSNQQKMEIGTSAAEVEALAGELEQEAKADLSTKGYDISCFDRLVDTDMGDALGGAAEVSYRITYSPKSYTVTGVDGQENTYRYGYYLPLEESANSSVVYDYYINGEYYPQGSLYRVSGDAVITREEGKPYTNTSLMSILADCFATEKEAAILRSGALLGDAAVSVRYPDTSSQTTVKLEEDVLTASNYPSNYRGLEWKPYSYTIGTETKYFDGTNTVVVPLGGFETIRVVYRLSLTNFSAEEIEQCLADIRTMADDAAGQQAAMEQLNAQYSNIGQLNKGMLNVLRSVIRDTQLHADSQKSAELQAYFVDIVNQIMENCVDTDNSLKIYNILTAYRASGNPMAYYLGNSESIIREVELLGGYLSAMMADDEKIEALRVLVDTMGKPEYADKLLDMRAIISEAASALTCPSARIDTGSKNLDVLAQALLMQGEMGSGNISGSLWLDTAPFVVEAPDKASIKVTVTAGERVVDTLVYTYEIGQTLTQADIDAVRSDVEAMVSENLQTKYYTSSVDVELDTLVGTDIRRTVNVSYHYEPHAYTVHISGEDDQTVTIEDLSVTLPKAPTGFRYDYLVDGTVCGYGSYRFTTEQLDRLFTEGSYTIERTMINVVVENFNNFMASLVEAGGDVLKFSASENRDTITVDVAAAGNYALYSQITLVAQAMINSPYDYIGMGGKGMMYTREDGDLEISLQAMVDAIIADDTFGSRKLIELREGGHLATTTLQMGNGPDALEQDIAFVINVTSTSDEIVSTGNTLEDIQDLLTFQSDGSVLNVDMGLPENYYQDLLTLMLMTGVVERDDLNGLRSGDALEFLFTFLDQMAADETVTTETFENTAAMMGREFDVAQHEIYYQYLTELVKESTFTFGRDECLAEMQVDIRPALDAAATDPGKASMLGMIKEYETGLVVDMSFVLRTNDDYEAMILDIDSGAFHYTTNLTKALDALTGSVTVLLQKDIAGDLVIPVAATLDLNGYTIDGDVETGESLIIIDSSRDSGACGGVTGKLYGDIMVLGGAYSADIAGYLKEGYIQHDGIVVNPGFSVSEDRGGNLTYTIDADALGADPEIAADLVYDLIYHYMTRALVAVDGSTVYSADAHDLLTLFQDGHSDDVLMQILLSGLDAEGFGQLLSAVYTDLADFSAVAGSVQSGEPVGSYEVEATDYDVEIEHVRPDDYLAFYLVTGLDTKAYSVDIVVEGSKTGAMAETLSSVLTEAEITVELEESGYDPESNTISLSGSKELTLELNFGENRDYAVMLGVLLASGEPSLREGIVRAVNAEDMDALKAVMDTATLRQLRNAFTAMKENVTFAQMAAGIGITADVSGAAALEKAYHHRLYALGQQIPGLDLQNGEKTLGSLESKNEPGRYVLTETDIPRSQSVDMGKYTLENSIPVTQAELTLNLFGGKAIEVLDASGKRLVSTDSMDEAVSALVNGGKLRLRKAVKLEKSLTIIKAIAVEGVSNLNMNGFYFLLGSGGSIDADGKLSVGSAVNGSVAGSSTQNGIYSYRLKSPGAPAAGANMADVWMVTHQNTTYLCVDIHPKQGNQLAELKQNLNFAELEALGDVSVTLSSGSGRVKTGDVLTVTVNDGRTTVFSASYTMVVAGDVNRDGMVNSGDAVAMSNIHAGNKSAYTYQQLLAADANKNGTGEEPRVDAGDAVRIMNKYLDWDAYLALLKK